MTRRECTIDLCRLYLILKNIDDHEWTHISKISLRSGIHVSSIRYTLMKLKEVGVVEMMKSFGTWRIRKTEKGKFLEMILKEMLDILNCRCEE